MGRWRNCLRGRVISGESEVGMKSRIGNFERVGGRCCFEEKMRLR